LGDSSTAPPTRGRDASTGDVDGVKNLRGILRISEDAEKARRSVMDGARPPRVTARRRSSSPSPFVVALSVPS
jgi:hypothetical protein